MKTRQLVSLLTLAAACLTPLAAHAASGEAEASSTGKGIVGGGLLGAELVLVTEAVLDVQPAWAYVVGGVAGAAGGAVGGYFVEQEAASARAPMLMLAGGLVLIIPTCVAVMAATAYQPPADYLKDEPVADEPVAEPPAPQESAPPPPADASPTDAAPAPTGRRHLPSTRRLSLQLPPPALLGFRDSRLALGIPNVAVGQAYTRTERIMFNAPDVTEIRVPVLDVVF